MLLRIRLGGLCIVIPDICVVVLSRDRIQVCRPGLPDLVLLSVVRRQFGIFLYQLIHDELEHGLLRLRVILRRGELTELVQLEAVRSSFWSATVHNVSDGKRHAEDLVHCRV